MRDCFISVGLAPMKDTEGSFQIYRNHRKGSLALKKVDSPDSTCLGEVASELEMVQRGGVASDDEGEAVEIESGEEEGEESSAEGEGDE